MCVQKRHSKRRLPVPVAAPRAGSGAATCSAALYNDILSLVVDCGAFCPHLTMYAASRAKAVDSACEFSGLRRCAPPRRCCAHMPAPMGCETTFPHASVMLDTGSKSFVIMRCTRADTTRGKGALHAANLQFAPRALRLGPDRALASEQSRHVSGLPHVSKSFS